MEMTQMNSIVCNISFVASNSSTVTLKKFDRFIFATYQYCNGIGNQMYRVAALYGIGLHLNRTPGFDFNKKCQMSYTREYLETFPNVMTLMKFHNLNTSNISRSDFGNHRYKFDDPDIIHDVPEKYLVLSGNLFQSYKYFHPVKNHIRKLFDFHPKIKDTVEAYGKKLFNNDADSHKMCVHIRRGDFITQGLLETRPDFLIPAMITVRNFVIAKYLEKNVSLIFLTTDWEFVNLLNFSKSDYSKIYYPQLNTRAENMYFGIRFCESFLLSASASTFGYWIAYFMPEGSPIFYNGQIEINRKGRFQMDYLDYDKFPKEWNMLELDRKNNIVVIDNRWYFEKFGLRSVSDKNVIHL